MADSTLNGKTPSQSLWLWILGIVLSVIALAFAVRGVHWAEVWEAIRSARIALVVLGLVTVLLTTVAKAMRWRWLLFPEHERMRLRDLLAALLVGQMLNTLVPARAGDLARAYHLGEYTQVSKATVLGSVVAEKVMDMVMLALCALIALPWLYLVPWVESSTLVLTVTAALALLVVVALAWFGEQLLERLYPLLQKLPTGDWLSRLGRSGVNGLQTFRNSRASFNAWLWSGLAYLLAVSINYVLFTAMDIHVPASVGLLLMVVLYVGAAPPSLPGKVGIFHGIAVLTLTVFGVLPSVALAYGALLHLLIFLPPTILGLLILSLRPKPPVRMEGNAAWPKESLG
jgi:uncharacterized protein (TIRG00374 family)